MVTAASSSARAQNAAPLSSGDIRRRLLSYLRPHTAKLSVGLACGLLAGLVPAGVVALIKQFGHVLDEYHGSGTPPLALTQICVTVVALYAGLWLFSYGQSIFLAEVAQKVGNKMRRDVYAHLQNLPLAYFHQMRTGALMSTLTSDVPKLKGAAMMIREVITTPVQIVVYLTALFVLSWKLTLFALFIIPFMGLAIQLLTKRLRRLSDETQEKTAELTVVMEETIAGVRVVKSFSSEDREIARFDEVNESSLHTQMQAVRKSARLTPTVDFLGALGLALTLWVGGAEVARGVMKSEDLLAFLFAVTQLATTVRNLGNLRVSWEEMMGAADRIFRNVLDVEGEVRDAPDAITLPKVEGAIRFQNVAFAYEPGRPTLQDITFDAAPGQVVALVGPSGAGKSTVVDLLPRFYEIQGGAIFVDGYDFRSVTLKSLRRQIGIVPQKTLLFGGTVRDNIAYGRPDATEAEVIAAACAANADRFIRAKPDGYDTVVGERGVMLSGGEQQRIAIARALLADPRILILDEATSALDTESERLVQEALETLMQGRTTLVIAHRLSTIVNADKILVVQSGRIVEEGTHSDLLAQGGLYTGLYERQKKADEIPQEVA